MKLRWPADARRSVEAWYVACAAVAAITTGIVPLVLPLDVSAREGQAVHAGFVMSMIGLGMLTSPIYGRLADRWRVHRWLCVGGALAVAVALSGFASTPDLTGIEELRYLIGLAILLGLGQAAVFTVANLLIVEAHPQAEWNERIGWLQTFITGGTVAGLLLGGVLTDIPLELAFLVAAGISAAAAVWFWLRVHRLRSRPVATSAQRAQAPERPPAPAIWQHTLAALRRRVSLRFGLFLLAWLLGLAGVSAIQNLYPLFMLNEYGVDPTDAGIALAVATGLSLPLYTPAGAAITHFGVLGVLRSGLLARLLCLAGLTALGWVTVGGKGWLAMAAVAGLTLAWPFLSVGGTILASQLAGTETGEGLGFYSAVAAIAALIGPALGGQIATVSGYAEVAFVGAAGIVLALLLLFVLPLLPGRPAKTAESIPAAPATPLLQLPTGSPAPLD